MPAPMMATVAGQFVGDAFLRLRERQDGIKHFKAFQKIREAAAVAVHLHKLREFLRVVARQLDAQVIAQLGNRRDANRAVEVQVQIYFWKLFEVQIAHELAARPPASQTGTPMIATDFIGPAT